MKNLLLRGALALALVTTLAPKALAQCTGVFASGNVCANSTASNSIAASVTVSALFDRVFGSTQNQVPYRGAGGWTALASANNAAWVTNGSGVPSLSQTLPNAVQDNITRLGTVTSGTWNGTVIAPAYGGTGVANNAANTLTWSGAFASTFTLTGVTNVTFPTSGTLATTAGASIPAVVQGDILYASGTNTLAALAKSATASRYLSNGGTSNNPSWAQVDLTNGVTNQLPLANGGTNANLTASNGGLVYSDASALAILAGTVTAGQIPRSGSSAAPSWSTATYPATTAQGTVLASATANTVAGTATPVLGIPGSVLGSLGLAGSTSGTVTIAPQAAAGTYNFNLPTGAGTNGQPLLSGGGGASPMTFGTLGVAAGGTGITSIAAGQVFNGSGVDTVTATSTPTLGANGGTGGQITLNGSTSGSAAIRVAAAAGTGTIFQLPADNGTNNYVLQTNGSGVTSWVPSAGGGTVTSVSITAGTGITQSGSPVTTSGAITVNVDKATASNYYAATSNKVVTTDVIYPSETTTTYGTTTTFDFDTFINTAVTLTGNITTQTFSNVRAGKAGMITFIQDGSGNRTTVWNSVCKWPQATAPALSTAINAVDVLTYSCRSTTFCLCTLAKGVG